MRCPGQDTRYWKSDAIFEVKCPQCGHQVEFFKDESTRKCKKCGHKLINPKMDFGCATYCKFARQCFGDPDLLTHRDELLKNRVAIEMKHYFQKDFKRIAHAVKVARYAEKILNQEKGDLAIVLSAAYLHDIGLKGTIPDSKKTKNHEKVGPIKAREILLKLGAAKVLIDEVCDIISRHHHPRDKESANFKIVYDADLIVNLEEQQGKNPVDKEKITSLINNDFYTRGGCELAREVLLSNQHSE